MTAPARTESSDVLSAFQGRIEPVAVPLLYKLGLAVAALAMVLLPLLYVGLVAGAGWLVYLHAVHNTTILDAGGGLVRLLLYFGPIVAGAILVLFMVKPLFAPAAEASEDEKLSRADEPLLFAFVEKICDLVGAPRPAELRVDNQVNASAGFRRGFLSLFRDDLVLTIGLPLAAGLRKDQLAGVIAHEFGHFAQGAGMRLSYIVRRVNHWFARVVYERDQWDVRLDRWASELDLRLRVIFWLAKLGVWISRKILWALMMAGHGISSFLLRQMEYDADSYETRLSGSKTFAETSVEIELLQLATQRAIENLNQTLQDERLVDDYAGLVAWRRSTMSDDAPERIRAALDDVKTSALDTHPATRDRIAAAEGAAAVGIFHDESPATQLFQDFERLSREVTARYYRHDLGLNLERTQLIPLEEFRRRAGDAEIEERALLAIFGGGLRSEAPLHAPAPAEVAAQEALERLRAAKSECERLLAERKDVIRQCAAADGRLATLHQADGLLRTGFRIDPKTFEVPASSHQAVDASLRDAERDHAAATSGLQDLDRAFEQRLAAAQDLIFSGASWLEVEDARQTADALRPTLAALREAAPDYRRLKTAALGLQAVANNAGSQPLEGEQIEALQNMASACAAALRAMRPKLRDAAYPFDHAHGRRTLEDVVTPSELGRGDFNGALSVGVAAYQTFETVYRRVMGRWASLLVTVEKAAFEDRAA